MANTGNCLTTISKREYFFLITGPLFLKKKLLFHQVVMRGDRNKFAILQQERNNRNTTLAVREIAAEVWEAVCSEKGRKEKLFYK